MADKPPPPPLDYQDDALLRSIRRGIRTLVFLTLVNTVLLGAGFFAPAIVAVAKEQWAAYQKSKADEAAAVAKAAADQRQAAQIAANKTKVLAAQGEAMSHLWPSGTLVFAEDFAVGTLPAVGTTSATLPATRNATTRGSAPAATSRPAFLANLNTTGNRWLGDPTRACLFIHARRARPELPERLVVVRTRLDRESQGGRRLFADVFAPTQTGAPLDDLADQKNIYIDLPRTVLRRGQSEPPALRFYAGTPDPLDESAWTIRYEFGAGTGTIAMRLRADNQIECRVTGPLESIMPSQ